MLLQEISDGSRGEEILQSRKYENDGEREREGDREKEYEKKEKNDKKTVKIKR